MTELAHTALSLAAGSICLFTDTYFKVHEITEFKIISSEQYKRTR